VAYCLCSVTRSLGGQLFATPNASGLGEGSLGSQQGPGCSPVSAKATMEAAAAAVAAGAMCGERKSFWELFAGWCVDGRSQGAWCCGYEFWGVGALSSFAF